MLDILFKFYFVFAREQEDRGAAGASFMLSIPLGLHIILLLLFIISFFIDIKEMGGRVGLFGAVIVFCTGMGLRNIYFTNARYKLMVFKNVGLYYFLGVSFFLFSIIFFVLMFIFLLNSSNTF